MLSFLGIGAQKAGTTWLYQQLRQHPDLAFPRGKEVHFWNNPHDEAAVAAYLGSFAQTRAVAGEITPAYGILPPEVITEIYRQAPGLRLIYLVRNPIERAWSAAKMDCLRGGMRLDEAGEQWFIDHFRSAGSRMRGDYRTCLRHWRSVFPAEQLLVLCFEEIRNAPEALLNRCFSHLGVTSRDPEELRRWGCRKAVRAGDPSPLPRRLLAELQALYEEDFRQYGADFNLDPAAWSAPEVVHGSGA